MSKRLRQPRVQGSVEAVKSEKTLAELAQQFDVHANRISTWRTLLLKRAAGIFSADVCGGDEPPVDSMRLHAKTGRTTKPEDDPICYRRSLFK